MAYASTVDSEEAYRSGQMACLLAASHTRRVHVDDSPCPGTIYSAVYDKVPLEKVAAADRSFPSQVDRQNGYDVTDDFVKYAMPLVGEDMMSLPMIGGRQRLTKFKPLPPRRNSPRTSRKPIARSKSFPFPTFSRVACDAFRNPP